MILPLRRVHRSAFVVLALVLPALLVGAWRARHAVVRQDLTPELLPKWAVDSANPRAYADELVYWTGASTEGLTTLPADAELIGSVCSGALGAEPPAGMSVIVYSLAQGKLVPAEGTE